MQEIGVGIIGFGFMGQVHTYGYRTLPFFYNPPPARIRLVAVCETRKDVAERAKDEHGFETATDDFRDLIARNDIQVVDVCTPNQFHKEALLAAIKAGKHIQCDKPLTATMDEAREVAAALRGYGAVGQMTLNSRFSPVAQRAKQMLEEGFVGNVVQFRAIYLHSGSLDPNKPMGWKQESAAGGGVINDLASHIVDLADWLIGPFTNVLAESRILYPERLDAGGRKVRVEAEDAVTILARTGAGATGIIEATKIATGANDEIRVEIHGDRGALRFNSMDPNYLEAYSMADPEMPFGGTRGWKRIDTTNRFPKPGGWPGPKFAVGWLRSHVHCLHHFVSAVAENKPTRPSLADGVRLQYMLDQIRKSAAARQWLQVSGEAPE